jgi:hypothetical protein
MEAERASTAIAIFVPGLEDTPGWQALSRKKQDSLLEHASHIQQNRQLQMLGEFGELMEIHKIQELLEGEEMKMTDVLRRIYPDRSLRTIQRKHEVFAQIVHAIPPAVRKRLDTIDIDTLGRFDRIANAALGDIRNAARELPKLVARTDKAAQKYLQDLDSKLLEHRQQRRAKPLHQNGEHAARMAANSLSNYIRSCGLVTSDDKRQWLVLVVGWVMEAQAVPGSISASRLSIPGGKLVPLGRPRDRIRSAGARSEVSAIDDFKPPPGYVLPTPAPTICDTHGGSGCRPLANDNPGGD